VAVLRKHKNFLWAALAAAGVVGAALLLWIACVRPQLTKGAKARICDDYSASTLLEDGRTASQTFAFDDRLLAVALEFEIPGDQPSGELEVVLRDADSGEEVGRSTGAMEYIVSGQYTVLGFVEEVPRAEGRRYRLEITPHYTGEGRLAVGHSATAGLWAEPMELDGQPGTGTMALWITYHRIGGFLTRFFLLVSGVAALLVFFGVWAALSKKLAIHRIVFVLVLGFGLLYGTVLPPYAAPDEKYHINQSFTLACKTANLFSPGEWRMGHVPTDISFRRESDVDELLQDENTTVFTWYRYITQLPSRTDDPFDSHQELAELQTDQNPILYLPSAMAVFAGYLLHLGFVPTLALGRLVNLFLFALLAAFAVKAAPFGKRVFAAAALLPMTLHLAASFSRDALLLGLCFTFTALFLAACRGSATRRGVAALLVCGLLLAPAKAVYLPVAALVLVLPAACLGAKPRVKKALYLAGCLALALALNSAMLTGLFRTQDTTVTRQVKQAPGVVGYEEKISENTTENFVRRLYYYVEGNDTPSETEVAFWTQAINEGDVSPVLLGQSFLFSPTAEAGDPDFLSKATLCFWGFDAIEAGDTGLAATRAEQGDLTAYKAVFSHEISRERWAELGLEIGGLDDEQFPLDRATLVPLVENARATRASQSVTEGEDALTYSPGYVLGHLPNTLLLVIRTVVQNTDHYLRTLVGGSLSYYTLDIAWAWVAALYFVLALAALPAGEEELPTGSLRLLCAAAAVLSALLVVAGCIAWTPRSSETIYGMQGRYFLPVLPLTLLTCLPRRLRAGSVQNLNSAVLCALSLINTGVLINAMLGIIAR